MSTLGGGLMGEASHNGLGPLREGQTVAVIGGGPAGSSCAIMLRRLASARGIPLRVVLFEHKDFSVNRNVCVGVLSPPFQRLLGELGLVLPERIIQKRITGYSLHSKRRTVYLKNPTKSAGTAVVDRADLDRFFVESVQAAGAEVMNHSVVDIRSASDQLLVVTSDGATVQADAVVGAFGLDQDALSIFQSLVPAFRPPRTTRSILTDIPAPEEAIKSGLEDSIHALLMGESPRVEFGALTPKRGHLTVNIAGDNITDDDLDSFLELCRKRKLIPETTFEDGRFYATFPSAPAQNIYQDRIVAIGNASGLLRPLKGKGINSGMITGMEAARTMVELGISRQAFDEFYRRCGDLTSEFSYGTFLRWLYHVSRRLDALDSVLYLARSEPSLYQALHAMVSGEDSYKEIVWRSAQPRLMGKIMLSIMRDRLRRRK